MPRRKKIAKKYSKNVQQTEEKINVKDEYIIPDITPKMSDHLLGTVNGQFPLLVGMSASMNTCIDKLTSASHTLPCFKLARFHIFSKENVSSYQVKAKIHDDKCKIMVECKKRWKRECRRNMKLFDKSLVDASNTSTRPVTRSQRKALDTLRQQKRASAFKDWCRNENQHSKLKRKVFPTSRHNNTITEFPIATRKRQLPDFIEKESKKRKLNTSCSITSDDSIFVMGDKDIIKGGIVTAEPDIKIIETMHGAMRVVGSMSGDVHKSLVCIMVEAGNS